VSIRIRRLSESRLACDRSERKTDGKVACNVLHESLTGGRTVMRPTPFRGMVNRQSYEPTMISSQSSKLKERVRKKRKFRTAIDSPP